MLLVKIIDNKEFIEVLNTYLKNQLSWYPSRKSIVSSKVKESLLQGNVEYMARMSSFDFEEDFFDDILVKFCDETAFENLLRSTVDYNSITSFYNQLQQILEKREGLFDVYQYYLFALIYQIVNRNDLKFCLEFMMHRVKSKIMRKEKLDELNSKINLGAAEDYTSSIGLVNVNSRIKIYYGKDYGMTIASKEGEGTTVTIRVKKVSLKS